MTVKTIFAFLLLTCVALSGPPPASGEQAVPAEAVPVSPAPPGGPGVNPATVQPAAAPGGGPAFPAFPAPPGGQPLQRGPANRALVPPAAGGTPGAIPAPSPATSIPAPGAAPDLAAAVAPAEEQLIPAKNINLTGADLNTLLITYAEMVNRSVLRSPTLQPNLTFFFVNQTPLTKAEAIQAYQALFAMNGVALIEVGDKFIKAVPAAESISQGQKPLVVTDASELGELGQYVTHIVQLKYVKPTEILPVLTPFQKMANAIFPIDSSQILVIRDFTENVKRMLEMIQKVDIIVPSEFDSRVVPIRFAKAEDIASALSSLSGSGSATTVGTRPAGGTTAPSGLGTRPGLGGYQQGGMGMQNQAGAFGSNPTGQPSAGGSFSDRISQIISRAAKTSGSGDFQIIGPNKIVADVRSNSLMIFASRADIMTITNIINQLDIVLAQVVIETIIMDVALEDTFSLGVSGVQTPRQFGGSFAGAGGMNANKFFDFSGRSNTNSAGDLLGSGLKYFGKVNDDIYVSIEAMASDGRVNVIQKPRIQTSHATPASIFIGSTVPYVSSSYGGGGYGGGYGGYPSSTYQQLSVGIGLNVTPFINADGLVVMKIDETIDEISGATKIDNNSVPNTTHRTLSAEVAVMDRETILLGGFIRNAETKSKAGVPYLKDIPLLGNLFSSRDSTKKRSELIVLMRPTVLRTPELASMHVAEEKAVMPMVSTAEAEAAKTEQELAGKSVRNRAAKDKGAPNGAPNGTPFTPEEIQLYGNPQSTPAPAPAQ